MNIKNNKCDNITNNININRDNYLCIHCNSDNIGESGDPGIMVCKDCGIVTDDCIENSMELVQYGEDGNKSANKTCSIINKLLPQSSMVTSISGSCSNIAKSMHNWGSIPYYEKKLNDVFKHFRFICNKAKIPKCIEDDAKIIFKIITDCKYTSTKEIKKNNDDDDCKNIIFRGKNKDGLKAACLSYACKKNKKPLSPKELSKLYGITIKKITKGNKLFDKFMVINNFTNYSEISPEYFVVHFCTELNLKKMFIDTILQIMKNIDKIQIANKHTPLSIATGSIFLLAKIYNLNITNKSIANYFNISQVTISKAYRNFEPFKKILLNNNLCNVVANKIKEYQDDIEIETKIKHKFIRFNVDITKINVKNNNYNIFDNNNRINYELLNKYNNELDNIILCWYDEYYELCERHIDTLFSYYINK